MASVIAEELKKKLGSGKLHKVNTIEIVVDEISESYVKLSIWTDIDKIGKFKMGGEFVEYVLSPKSTLRIETNKDFKVKQRITLS